MKKFITGLLVLGCMPSYLLADITQSMTKNENGIQIKVTKDTEPNITLNIQVSGSNDRDIAAFTELIENLISSRPMPQSWLTKQQVITALLASSVTAGIAVAVHLHLKDS